jgi:hypothetical protein
MIKQRNMLAVLKVVLVLALIGIAPYSGLTEESDQKKTVEQTKETTATVETSDDGGEKTAESEADVPAVVEIPLSPITATTKVAENERYALFIDKKTGNLRVISKKTNKEWLGAPQVPKTTMPNNKKFMDSPVHIKYTEGADTSQAYTLKDKDNILEIQMIDQGYRTNFTLPELKISFSVEYRLRNDGLEVKVPYDSIKEEGKHKLVGMEVLPFFNAGHETDEGALFVPDGSGALMLFRERHRKYFSGYSEPVYGPDYAYFTQSHNQILQGWKRAMPPKEHIALPVFGSYRNGTGFLGILTQNEMEARINATPAGIRSIPIYRVSAEYVYRKQDVIFIGRSGQVPLYQGDKTEGDRTTRFVLLEDEEANYVGMAKAYRKYLIEEKDVQPVKSEKAKLNIRLMNGILRDEVIGKTFVAMTTFEQVKYIIDSYAGKGINELEITMDGWSDDGLYGDQPDHFPVERRLGGKSELKELAKYAKDRGIDLYLQANYVKPFEESDGFSRRKDTIRGIDREVLPAPNYYVSTRFTDNRKLFYYLKPEQVYNNHIAKEIDDYQDLGVAGVHLKYMGDTVYSDEDPNRRTNRKLTVDFWSKAIDELRDKVGKASVDYGFAYALGRVDRIDNAPMDSSHFVYTDRTVPFYQIVVRGLVPYTAKPTNLRNDARVEFLRAVEYGAAPSYELTFEAASKLLRTMEDRLFSSDYKNWLDPSVNEYVTYKELYTKISDQPIVDHEQLAKKVFKTSYGNGTQIIVNYGKEAVKVDGQLVNALDFAVVGGEE